MALYPRFFNYFGFKGLYLRTLIFVRYKRNRRLHANGNTRFVWYKACNRLFYFKLVDQNGITLLQSDGCFHYSKCQSDIILVKQNAVFTSRYKKLSSNQGYYFELVTTTGKPVAKSSFYKTASERDYQVRSLAHTARFAPVENALLEQMQ